MHYNLFADVDEEGSTILVSCCTTEGKPIEKHWIRYGSQFSENATGLTNPNLLIPSSSLSDEGIYYCLSGNTLNISVFKLRINFEQSEPAGMNLDACSDT